MIARAVPVTSASVCTRSRALNAVNPKSCGLAIRLGRAAVTRAYATVVTDIGGRSLKDLPR